MVDKSLRSGKFLAAEATGFCYEKASKWFHLLLFTVAKFSVEI